VDLLLGLRGKHRSKPLSASVKPLRRIVWAEIAKELYLGLEPFAKSQILQYSGALGSRASLSIIGVERLLDFRLLLKTMRMFCPRTPNWIDSMIIKEAEDVRSQVSPHRASRTERADLTPARVARLIRAFRENGEDGRRTVKDTRCPGLRLVIGQRTATWTYSYRPRGKDENGRRPAQRTIAFGDAANIAPDAARTKVAELRAAVAERRDPLEEKSRALARSIQAERDAAVEAEERNTVLTAIANGAALAVSLDFSVLAHATLEQCASAFIRYGARGKAKTLRDARMHLERGLAEMHASSMKPAELHRSKVSLLVQLHASRPATARHRLGWLVRLYKWLMKIGAVDASPAAAEEPPPPPAPRTRVYSAAEVKALWDGADRLSPARRDLLRLLLLLPLRREELASTTIGDIRRNGDRLELVVASTRSKNRREYVTPIVGEARSITDRLLADGRPADAFLIPLTETGKPFTAWKRFAQGVYKGSGVAFRPHDCRRLFATECGEHGLGDFATVDAALNHAVSASVTGAARHYHHGKGMLARQHLLAAWSNLILHAAASGRWPQEERATAENVIHLAPGVAK
jgi:integrase